MLGQYLIAFREGLEAALIAAVLLAYLARTERRHLTRYVLIGVYLAIAASTVLGVAVWLAYGAVSGPGKALFEGVAALIAVAVLTSMIIWMAFRRRGLKGEVERRMGASIAQGTVLGLVLLAFVLVLREGFETVLFLTPFLVTDAAATVSGAALGIGAALLLAFFIFKVGMRIDLNRFFAYSAILLTLLAAGLAGYGTHELMEYGKESGADIGWFGSTAYDLGLSPDDPLHHKGTVGSIPAVMLGYAASAEWGRVLVHLLYAAIVMPIVILSYKRPDLLEAVPRALRKVWRTLRRPSSGPPADIE